MTRQGPAESATKNTVGTKKRGLDGNMWVVAKASNGVHRWVKVVEAPAVKPVLPMHHLLHCEPATYSKGSLNTDTPLTVDDVMYKKILRGPKIYRTGQAENAYVFGKKFPLHTYVAAGGHFNDVAQTGFLDLDLIQNLPEGTPMKSFGKTKKKQKETEVPDIYEIMKSIYYRKGKFPGYDSREALAALRKVAPYVIFIGETDGGDVGADLYIHRSGDTIDSIIIDNRYFFPR
ncbi:hypothetical protein BNJ_00280 [Kaumoebavirus]|uniref:hypothetical protein n=1 Tax=Kaumoebavirus TaxID=1859492 RepID=UPI0009C269FA|nr:hypothetical protein BNJ_00280 [Kaumoebavirus]ARA72103.1 hypothetical protein BNJ_00280 [Kaumoebavirus]